MNIAVLGSNGFIGKSLVNYLKTKHKVFALYRETNLLDFNVVKEFLLKNEITVVVNAAAVMKNNFFDVQNNLGIFFNFLNNHDHFIKFIDISSGAAYNKNRNLDNISEERIFEIVPSNFYDYSQNLKIRTCYEIPNAVSLTLFNCFGSNEINTRLFPTILKSKDVVINKDRYFDYFSIQDFLKVVEHILFDLEVKHLNLVYKNKYKISDVAKKFIEFHNLDKKIIIESESSFNYTGNGNKLNNLNLKLNGLEHGLKNY